MGRKEWGILMEGSRNQISSERSLLFDLRALDRCDPGILFTYQVRLLYEKRNKKDFLILVRRKYFFTFPKLVRIIFIMKLRLKDWNLYLLLLKSFPNLKNRQLE